MISIIIINYNVSSEVEACLNSILKIFNFEYEVLIVDNNSSDRSIEELKDKFPAFKFIFLESNLGFARANNYAADIAKGEFILFLNPDTIIVEDFVTPILNNMTTDAGACGPKLVNKDQSFQSSAGIRLGYLYEFCEAFMLISFLRSIYNNFYLRKESPAEVSWLSAACMIVRRKIFMEAGEFNPEFFLNYEDIDLCERIRKAGYRNYYFHKYICVHIDQKSQKKDFSRLVYDRYAGRLIYAGNNYRPIKRSIIKFIHRAGLFLRIWISPLLYKGTELSQRLSGYKKATELYNS